MEEKLRLAMRAVKKGQSLKGASKQFNVARTTLKRHLSNPNGVRSSGRPRFFSESEEQLLHQILRNIQVLQQPFSRPKFVEVAKKLAARKVGLGGADRNFGKEWLYKFVRRHPDLCLRSRAWRSEQKQWTPEKCEKYIQVLEYLNREGFLSDPRAIFALDSLELITPPKEYTKSGNLIPRKPSNEIGFAVFACGSADGVALKPMILRDENLLLEHWFTERKEEVVVGHNITGSLDAEALTLYLKRELVPHLQSLDPPVEKSTLFLDGRWSHAYNLEILECCLLHNIQVVCFPVGHSDKLQPLQATDFRQVAKVWTDYVVERDYNQLNEFLSDRPYTRKLAAAQYREHIPNLLRAGFQMVGVYPFAPDVIRSSLPTPSPLPNPQAAEETFFRLVENYCLQIGGEHGLSEPVLQRALEAYKRSLHDQATALSEPQMDLQMDFSDFAAQHGQDDAEELE